MNLRSFTILCMLLAGSIIQAQLAFPLYHKGKAILTGKVENYRPSEDLDFRIGAPNIVMGTSESLFPTIEADGSFKVEVPLYHDTQVRMIIGKVEQTILLSPEKESGVIVNLQNKPGKQFCYSGEYAHLNNELSQPELITDMPIIYKDGKWLDAILGISANEFKERCINVYKSNVAHNDSMQQFSLNARTLANLTCAFKCLHNLQAAIYCLQTAHQKKNNLTREQATAVFLNTPLPNNYYDYLDSFPVNHPLALYCYYYRDAMMALYTTRRDVFESDHYLLKEAPLTAEEKTLLHKRESAFKAGIVFQQESDRTALYQKYEEVLAINMQDRFEESIQRLSRILSDSTCQFIDYHRAIFMRSSLYNFKPLNTQQKTMASQITNPIFRSIIEDMDQQMQPHKKSAAMQAEKKSIVCQAPQVPESELLAALIARHKGKVQFIDFWATWCGGCRQIIKEYEPLKKELTEEQVAFVYLTGPSSVESTWNTLISNITGEHYWLNKEQWNFLWKDFKMKGLPMYLLIDKKGNIVKKFTHITAKELKDLLAQEINKE